MNDVATPTRIGWPELVTAVVTAVGLYLVGGAVVFTLPTSSEVAGLLQFALSAAVPALAFLAAVLARRRGLRAFGFRRVRPAWLLVAVGVGLVAMVLASLLSVFVLTPLFPGGDEIQADYHSAATGGLLSFLGVMALGGLIEPVGEELLFRGVLAGVLRPWGPWVTVLGTSVIFALAHGINVVAPSAFIMSLGATALFWRTGSIWPAAVVHVVYNSSSLVLQSMGF